MIDSDSNKINIHDKNRFSNFQEPLDTAKAQEIYYSSEVGFSINNTSQGTGKTWGLTKDIQKRRKKNDESIAFFTTEHTHIENEIIPHIDGIKQRMGLIKWAEENKDHISEDKGLLKHVSTKQDKIDKLKELTRDYKVAPRVASKIVLGEDNGYTEQFEGNNYCVADPLQFLHLPGHENRDTIYIDEDIRGKGKVYRFNLDQQDYNAVKDQIWSLDENGYYSVLDQDEKLIVKELFKRLFKIKSRARRKAVSNQIGHIKQARAFSDHFIELKPNQKYLVWKDIELLDFNDPEDLQLLVEIEKLCKGNFQFKFNRISTYKGEGTQSGIRSIIISLQEEAAKREDWEFLNHLKNFKQTLNCVRNLDSTITVAETIKEVEGEIQSDKGKIHGNEGGKAWFYHKRPLFDRLMELRDEDVEIKWAYANLEEEYLKELYHGYKRREENRYKKKVAKDIIGEAFDFTMDSTAFMGPEEVQNALLEEEIDLHKAKGKVYRLFKYWGDNYPVQPEPEVFNPELNIPSSEEYKAEITRLRLPQNRSSSKSSLSRKQYWRKIFRNLKPLIDENTGIITYKKFVSPEGNKNGPLIQYLEKGLGPEVKDKIFYFGGGIQGSNKLRDSERLFIVGTFNKDREVYANTYHQVYGEWPYQKNNGELKAENQRRTRENQLIGYQDRKMDFIHKLEVRNPLIDNLHRLRDLRTEPKEIAIIAPPYDELERYAEDKGFYQDVGEKMDDEGYQLEHGDKLKEKVEQWKINCKAVENLAKTQGKMVSLEDEDQEIHKVIKEPYKEGKEETRQRVKEDIKQYLGNQGEVPMTELKENVRGDDSLIIKEVQELDSVKVSPIQEKGGSKTVHLE